MQHYEMTIRNVKKFQLKMELKESLSPASEDFNRVLHYIETQNLHHTMDKVQYLLCSDYVRSLP